MPILQNLSTQGTAADYAVIDPQLMAGMPASLTAVTGLDALAHAIEAYTSTLATDYSDFLSEKVIDEICTYLPRAVASDIAGHLLVSAHSNAGHSIGQTVGSYYNIPHGMACAYAEPWVMEFNAASCPEKIRRIGIALGLLFSETEAPDRIGTKVRDAFIQFRDEQCGLPDISTFHCNKEMLDEVAEVCSKEFFQQFNPCQMTKADCLAVLNKMI